MNLGLLKNQSANTSRNYKITTENLETSTNRLSSGYRINRSADDAAGLSISEQMRKQIRGLNAASRNIQDGASYVQVADAALGEVQTILHRINELSVQAANDTNTDSDRTAIDNEIQELKKEIDHIFTDTRFNSMQIWGEDNSIKIPVGVEPVRAVTPTNYRQSFQITEASKWAVPKSHYTINADADGYWVSWTGYNGNTYSTIKTTWPNETEWPKDANTGNLAEDVSLNIKVDSSTLDITSHPELADFNLQFNYNIARDSTIQNIVDSIHNTNISTENTANANISLTRNNASANGLSLSTNLPSIEYAAFLYSDRTFGTNDTSFMEPKTPNNYIPSTGSEQYKAEFVMGTQKTSGPNTTNTTDHAAQSPWYVTATSKSAYMYANSYNGMQNYEDNYWYTEAFGQIHSKFINIGSSLNGLQQAAYDANRTNLHTTTVSYCLTFALKTTNTDYINLHGNNDVGSFTFWVHNISASTTPDDIQAIMDSITSIDFSASNYGTAHIQQFALSNATKNITINQTTYDYGIGLHIQSGHTANNDIEIKYNSLRTRNLGLADTNTKTHSDAEAAIDAVANALEIVSEQRSLFGSYENRFDYAKANADNTGENTQAAESRIRDTDMADEMVRYSLYNILRQAGESVLAQQKSSMSQVLSLLQ